MTSSQASSSEPKKPQEPDEDRFAWTGGLDIVYSPDDEEATDPLAPKPETEEEE